MENVGTKMDVFTAPVAPDTEREEAPRPQSRLETTGPPDHQHPLLPQLQVVTLFLFADIFPRFHEVEASLVLTIIPSVTYLLLCLWGLFS